MGVFQKGTLETGVKPEPPKPPVVDPVTAPGAKPAWFLVAEKELGVAEFSGSASNPRIENYHRAAGLSGSTAHEDTPWCASFVTWCLEQAGLVSTNSAWARSYLKWGVELKEPKLGCVVVFSRGATTGHVGFFVEKSGSNLVILGGNQGNKVCLAKYPESRVLGYRWPKS